MKKMFICMVVGVLALSCLAGCSTQPTKDADSKASAESSQSSVSAQAFESSSEASADEQAKEEKERKAAITEQYSIYSEYGLTYDSEKDRFFYAGNMVRYFSDKISEEHTNAFFYAEGTIDLNPVRDSSGKLTGLTVASDDEFAARTEKQAELETEFQNAGVENSTGSFEMGDPDARDNTLDEYSKYGVSYDTATKKWMYDGKQIYFFYDADNGTTFIDYDATNGLKLKVSQDKSGNSKSIETMTDEEMEKIMN